MDSKATKSPPKLTIQDELEAEFGKLFQLESLLSELPPSKIETETKKTEYHTKLQQNKLTTSKRESKALKKDQAYYQGLLTKKKVSQQGGDAEEAEQLATLVGKEKKLKTALKKQKMEVKLIDQQLEAYKDDFNEISLLMTTFERRVIDKESETKMIKKKKKNIYKSDRIASNVLSMVKENDLRLDSEFQELQNILNLSNSKSSKKKKRRPNFQSFQLQRPGSEYLTETELEAGLSPRSKANIKYPILKKREKKIYKNGPLSRVITTMDRDPNEDQIGTTSMNSAHKRQNSLLRLPQSQEKKSHRKSRSIGAVKHKQRLENTTQQDNHVHLRTRKASDSIKENQREKYSTMIEHLQKEERTKKHSSKTPSGKKKVLRLKISLKKNGSGIHKVVSKQSSFSEDQSLKSAQRSIRNKSEETEIQKKLDIQEKEIMLEKIETSTIKDSDEGGGGDGERRSVEVNTKKKLDFGNQKISNSKNQKFDTVSPKQPAIEKIETPNKRQIGTGKTEVEEKPKLEEIKILENQKKEKVKIEKTKKRSIEDLPNDNDEPKQKKKAVKIDLITPEKQKPNISEPPKKEKTEKKIYEVNSSRKKSQGNLPPNRTEPVKIEPPKEKEKEKKEEVPQVIQKTEKLDLLGIKPTKEEDKHEPFTPKFNSPSKNKKLEIDSPSKKVTFTNQNNVLKGPISEIKRVPSPQESPHKSNLKSTSKIFKNEKNEKNETEFHFPPKNEKEEKDDDHLSLNSDHSEKEPIESPKIGSDNKETPVLKKEKRKVKTETKETSILYRGSFGTPNHNHSNNKNNEQDIEEKERSARKLTFQPDNDQIDSKTQKVDSKKSIENIPKLNLNNSQIQENPKPKPKADNRTNKSKQKSIITITPAENEHTEEDRLPTEISPKPKKTLDLSFLKKKTGANLQLPVKRSSSRRNTDESQANSTSTNPFTMILRKSIRERKESRQIELDLERANQISVQTPNIDWNPEQEVKDRQTTGGGKGEKKKIQIFDFVASHLQNIYYPDERVNNKNTTLVSSRSIVSAISC